MGILDVKLNETYEPALVEEGEKELRILTAVAKTNVNNKPFISMSFEGLENPEADLIYANVYLPDGENARKDNTKRVYLTSLCEEFGIGVNKDGGVDTDDMPGCTGFVMIKHKKDQNDVVRAEVGLMAGGK